MVAACLAAACWNATSSTLASAASGAVPSVRGLVTNGPLTSKSLLIACPWLPPAGTHEASDRPPMSRSEKSACGLSKRALFQLETVLRQMIAFCACDTTSWITGCDQRANSSGANSPVCFCATFRDSWWSFSFGSKMRRSWFDKNAVRPQITNSRLRCRGSQGRSSGSSLWKRSKYLFRMRMPTLSLRLMASLFKWRSCSAFCRLCSYRSYCSAAIVREVTLPPTRLRTRSSSLPVPTFTTRSWASATFVLLMTSSSSSEVT